MSQSEIAECAYFMHIKYPKNSKETNWFLAETEINDSKRERIMNIHNIDYNNNTSPYVVDFLKPNFYTTEHLKIDHYNTHQMERFKEKVYRWGMDNFFDVLKKLVDEFESEY